MKRLERRLNFTESMSEINIQRMFQADGQKVPGTMCDYQFVSSNFSLSKGRFYSPRYPSGYPRNIKCAYRFRASVLPLVLLFESDHIADIFDKTLLTGDVNQSYKLKSTSSDNRLMPGRLDEWNTNQRPKLVPGRIGRPSQ
ncbi:hypothetical protein J437_LFUL013138 [Ladona fulva]|uniref:CUB domain-containing protein n=1 Tax=Ladona fulva TaxID=123851 RepID=A0A8K0KEL5_LADFU|nr:hypothetical protein J437_LFUL013138 [Ladona fulva]